MRGGRLAWALVVLTGIAVPAALWFGLPRSAAPEAGPARESRPQTERPTGPEASGPLDLGAVLTFVAAGDCGLAEPLASIVEDMVRIDPDTQASSRGGPIAIPGYDRPIMPTFERVREVDGNADMRTVTAELDLPGTWHGLRVTRLRRIFMEESDVAILNVDFDEPAEKVREVLNHAGFELPPVGESRASGPPEGIQFDIGVDRLEQGGAILFCAT